jgi:hypothetical protein
LSLFQSAPDCQCEVHGGDHGKAGSYDHGHEDWGEEPKILIVEQTESPKKKLQLYIFGMQDIPDDESEESGEYEDIIKHCKSNQQLVESFLELFPFHDADSEHIS